ncbi:hypothetical protein R2601_03998 [Salipiger bermudensis HTCC2601]|uniref:Uncharacterized protein n=1 Tax=Salipiger bermudensis (strain DSM 26914 / JCM 13377 / KCTC 12554 / HTCC2601) TaxID=314265 RepID=Q0FW46_SALBH|nr:hypothetical protein R2601_03998 [Salipiger bermudensis HTCC2601]
MPPPAPTALKGRWPSASALTGWARR